MSSMKWCDDGVEVCEEFAHAGHQGDFLCLAAAQQMSVVISDDGIVSCCNQGGHVERAAYG